APAFSSRSGPGDAALEQDEKRRTTLAALTAAIADLLRPLDRSGQTPLEGTSITVSPSHRLTVSRPLREWAEPILSVIRAIYSDPALGTGHSELEARTLAES